MSCFPPPCFPHPHHLNLSARDLIKKLRSHPASDWQSQLTSSGCPWVTIFDLFFAFSFFSLFCLPFLAPLLTFLLSYFSYGVCRHWKASSTPGSPQSPKQMWTLSYEGETHPPSLQGSRYPPPRSLIFQVFSLFLPDIHPCWSDSKYCTVQDHAISCLNILKILCQGESHMHRV